MVHATTGPACVREAASSINVLLALCGPAVLMEHFADEFNKQLGGGQDVRTAPRAMAKLRKQVGQGGSCCFDAGVLV